MRMLAIVGVLCLVVVAALIVLILSDHQESPNGSVSERLDGLEQQDTEPNAIPRRDTSSRPMVHEKGLNTMVDEEREAELGKGVYDKQEILRFGQEFEEKWAQDRERLGENVHREMEKLWFEGRRPRGSKESIEKLEKLLNDFPNTNRAGCAAWELGHHYLRSRDLSLEERRKKAEQVWHLVEQRYPETLCEYNTNAAAMSKLAMASWVYRYTDPIMAKRVLEEIIEKHSGETDHLGQPLEVVARRLLDQLNAAPQ